MRWVGQPEFASGWWVGVELDEPVGKHNGTVRVMRTGLLLEGTRGGKGAGSEGRGGREKVVGGIFRRNVVRKESEGYVLAREVAVVDINPPSDDLAAFPLP